MEPTALSDKIEDLLPHRPPLLLLDGLICSGSDYVEVFVDHNEPSLYSDSLGHVPSWVGIEYMAQCISVFGGLERRRQGLPPTIGFLLGTRRYTAYTQYFNQGTRVVVRAVQSYRSEENIVQFRCCIRCDGELLAEADIKAIQPERPDDILGLTKKK